MVDLLTVGEAFAELDLIVRQLDDGSLTLSVDDSLPDEERLRVQGLPSGMSMWQRVGQVPFNTDLCRGLDALNARAVFGRWVWRAGSVRVEAHLPFADRSLGPNQLSLAFGALHTAAREHGSQLLAVARGEASWESLREGAALPPSYLPGVGQKTLDQRTTMRYGGPDEVPGKPELTGREAKRPSQRTGGVSQPVVTARPGGGGGGLVALLLLLTVGAVGGAGWALYGRLQATEQAATGPGTPVGPGGQAPDGQTPVAPDGQGPGEEPQGEGPNGEGPNGEAPGAATGDPARPTPPRPRPAALGLAGSESELLEQLRAHPEESLRLVGRWLDMGWDRGEGARRRLLDALPRGDLPPDVVRDLMKSVRDRPLDPFEAMDCYPLAPTSVQRLLLQGLAGASEGRDEVARFLTEHLSEDTADRLMQEGLLALGRPRPETISALLAARGAEWVLLGDGRALVEAAVKAELERVKPLAEHEDEEVRGFACGLLGQSARARDALRLLAPLLSDRSEKVQARAIEACVQLEQPDACWPLARALQRAEPGTARDALRDAFRRLPARSTVPLLRKLYEKEQPSDRLAAVLAFEACEAKEAVPGLIGALSDADREVRLAAINALSGFQNKKPALRPSVMEGLAAIRAMALDKSDRELSRLASQLHLKIAGRMPDAR